MADEERRVDWDVVDDELYQIPAVYKDGRFDSLKHVLTVLGAVDSEAALDEVGAPCDSRACGAERQRSAIE